jgi:hypothetical protein
VGNSNKITPSLWRIMHLLGLRHTCICLGKDQCFYDCIGNSVGNETEPAPSPFLSGSLTDFWGRWNLLISNLTWVDVSELVLFFCLWGWETSLGKFSVHKAERQKSWLELASLLKHEIVCAPWFTRSVVVQSLNSTFRLNLPSLNHLSNETWLYWAFSNRPAAFWVIRRMKRDNSVGSLLSGKTMTSLSNFAA